MSKLRENIISYCQNSGITIAEFERRTKLSNGTVGRLSQENTGLSLASLNKISTHTGIPISKWIGE